MSAAEHEEQSGPCRGSPEKAESALRWDSPGSPGAGPAESGLSPSGIFCCGNLGIEMVLWEGAGRMEMCGLAGHMCHSRVAPVD